MYKPPGRKLHKSYLHRSHLILLLHLTLSFKRVFLVIHTPKASQVQANQIRGHDSHEDVKPSVASLLKLSNPSATTAMALPPLENTKKNDTAAVIVIDDSDHG